MNTLRSTPVSDDSFGKRPGKSNLLLNAPISLRAVLRFDVIALVAIFIILYFFKLANFSLSIDDEFAAIRISPEVWVIQGRWMSYLIERFAVTNSVVPFFPMLIFGISLAISYRLLLNTVGVRRLRRLHYLTFPLFAAYPTWYFLAAFASNILAAALGLFCVMKSIACFAAASHTPLIVRRRWQNVVASALALAISLGCYQAFVFLFLTLAAGLLLVRRAREETSSAELAKMLGCLAGILVAGVLIYKIVDTVARYLLHLGSTTYLDAFANWHSLVSEPLSALKNMAHAVFAVYSGSSEIYGVRLLGVPLLLALGLVGLLQTAKSNASRCWILIFAAGMSFSPFILDLTAGGAMPTRTMLAIPSIVWFFSAAALTAGSRPLAAAAVAVTVFTIAQIVYVDNFLQAANQLARTHDEALAGSIYLRIALSNNDSASGKPYKVDFYGSREFNTTYPRPYSSTAGWSFFSWDGGNQARILSYMHLIGYDDLIAADDARRRADLAFFQQMPVWPASGSVTVVGDTTLVKLGNTPGWPFNVP